MKVLILSKWIIHGRQVQGEVIDVDEETLKENKIEYEISSSGKKPKAVQGESPDFCTEI